MKEMTITITVNDLDYDNAVEDVKKYLAFLLRKRLIDKSVFDYIEKESS